jgi:hypothetical protein
MQPDEPTEARREAPTDPPVDSSTDEPTSSELPRPRPNPVPGETLPPAARRRLEHPPSDRFAVSDLEPESTGSLVRAIVGAAVSSLAGAATIVILASPLALSEPLVLVALVTGLIAGRAARSGGGRAVSRRSRRTIAAAIVLGAIAGAQIVVWQLALSEGGVLPLGEYLLQVFGPVAPLELVAAGAAAWATA